MKCHSFQLSFNAPWGLVYDPILLYFRPLLSFLIGSQHHVEVPNGPPLLYLHHLDCQQAGPICPLKPVYPLSILISQAAVSNRTIFGEVAISLSGTEWTLFQPSL